ncbi:MAG TPA: response regulator [Thermodesulfovibrionales bacterium]|nr:response regulator [Thermodesulfovibrionales bacterium]
MKKLLLVDDSITIHKVVELILSGEGFEIKAMNNGEEALAVLPTFKPDIVLADVEMPKMNGYVLCEKIKQDPSTSGIPVLLLAGAFEPFDEENAKKVGADGFVIKPFESQELINKVNEAITSSAVLKEAFGGPETPHAGEAIVEEDLWAMEEMPGPGDIEGVHLEEVETEEEDLFRAAKEVGVSIGAEPKKPAPPLTEKAVPAEEAGVLEAELPSKDELKEIFEKNLNSRMLSLLSAVDIKETVSSSLIPLMKDSLDKVLNETIPDVTERILHAELKGIFEAAVNDKISSLLSSVDIKETIQSSLMPLIKDPVEKIISETVPGLTEKVLQDTLKVSLESLAKDAEQVISKTLPEVMEKILKDTLSLSLDFTMKATEKTIGEILPGLVEKTLRDELKVSLESLNKEIEKIIWKTIPDLAEAIISKEIERIRSEF